MDSPVERSMESPMERSMESQVDSSMTRPITRSITRSKTRPRTRPMSSAQLPGLLVAAVMAGCGQRAPAVSGEHAGPAPAARVDPTERAMRYDPGLLRTLAVLATRHEPAKAELDALGRELSSGRLTIEQHVETLVAGPAFAEQVAPLVIL